MSDKFCINCKHYLGLVIPRCRHERTGRSLVTGQIVGRSAQQTRDDEDACAPAALWFEPKQPSTPSLTYYDELPGGMSYVPEETHEPARTGIIRRALAALNRTLGRSST